MKRAAINGAAMNGASVAPAERGGATGDAPSAGGAAGRRPPATGTRAPRPAAPSGGTPGAPGMARPAGGRAVGGGAAGGKAVELKPGGVVPGIAPASLSRIAIAGGASVCAKAVIVPFAQGVRGRELPHADGAGRSLAHPSLAHPSWDGLAGPAALAAHADPAPAVARRCPVPGSASPVLPAAGPCSHAPGASPGCLSAGAVAGRKVGTVLASHPWFGSGLPTISTKRVSGRDPAAGAGPQSRPRRLAGRLPLSGGWGRALAGCCFGRR